MHYFPAIADTISNITAGLRQSLATSGIDLYEVAGPRWFFRIDGEARVTTRRNLKSARAFCTATHKARTAEDMKAVVRALTVAA